MRRAAQPHEPSPISLSVLDALRGFAALYVMFGHARWLLWIGYQDYVASEGRGVGMLFALASGTLRYGHQAVLLFFLISGFCIHYRQARMLAAGDDRRRADQPLLGVRGYARRRFRRLYPPLVLALGLTALFDTLGSSLNPGFYSGLSPYQTINEALIRSSYSLVTLLGNLLVQATFAVPVFGSNGPLWSLSYEFWFYVLYPVLLPLTARFGPWRMLGIIGVISAVGFIASHAVSSWVLWVFTYWIVWAGGALITEAHAGRVQIRAPRSLLLGGGLILTALALTLPLSLVGDIASDLLCGAGMGLLLAWTMLSTQPAVQSVTEVIGRWLRPLGTVSYSLYVVHFPWLAFLSAWWLASHEQLPKGAELAVPGALSAIVLAVGCWYVVERHFVSDRAVRVTPHLEPLEPLGPAVATPPA
jgi:peptidoglycan/LPS O-acetylase OafA/YrhL